MRTKEEMTDLITEIDNRIGTVKDKKDTEYLSDVKAALQLVLKKLSDGQELSEIEEEMIEITHKAWLDEAEGGMEEADIKAFLDYMNREFDGRFRGRDPYSVLNVADALDWVLEDTSTEEFLSNSYLNLK